jgi:hypothetical protein
MFSVKDDSTFSSTSWNTSVALLPSSFSICIQLILSSALEKLPMCYSEIEPCTYHFEFSVGLPWVYIQAEIETTEKINISHDKYCNIKKECLHVSIGSYCWHVPYRRTRQSYFPFFLGLPLTHASSITLNLET